MNVYSLFNINKCLSQNREKQILKDNHPDWIGSALGF
jgi:hypothetical protein